MRWTWHDLGRYLAAMAGVAALGYFAFIGGDRVPLLGMFDLGIHELGHLVAMPFPQLVTILAGSALQIAVPAGLSAYFITVRRDSVAGAVTLAWAGTSARDVAVYVADAPYQALPLLYPNAIHDWAWLLGPEGFDAIGAAGTISRAFALAGGLAVLAALGVLGHALWRSQRPEPQGWYGARPRTVRPARRPPQPAPTEFHPGGSG